MVTFKNNNRRSNFRRNERNFKNNSLDKSKFNGHIVGTENYQRKNSTRNNQNAYKLFEKYNNLARETLSSGDKILSENYFQHADHFKRILNEQENIKKEKSKDNQEKEIVAEITSIDENISKKSEKENTLQQDTN